MTSVTLVLQPWVKLSRYERLIGVISGTAPSSLVQFHAVDSRSVSSERKDVATHTSAKTGLQVQGWSKAAGPPNVLS